MFELLRNRETHCPFNIIAYTAVACSCSLDMILEIDWPHWR